MKKHFLTLEQVTKIINYYKDKVIGFPIDKIDHLHWLISDVNLVTENGEDWNIVIWSKGEGSEGVNEDLIGGSCLVSLTNSSCIKSEQFRNILSHYSVKINLMERWHIFYFKT